MTSSFAHALGELTRRLALVLLAGSALVIASCDVPLGLDLPATLELERGASAGLSLSAFEVAGSYTAAGVPWKIDAQLEGASSEHIVIDQGATHLEAITVGNQSYFRSRDFLSQRLGAASEARTLISAAGNAWWKGSVFTLPNLGDFADGGRFRTTFLGTAITQRTDHVSVDGIDTVDMSGPRADVYIAEGSPHLVIRVRVRPGAVVDGITAADLHYSHYGASFGIAAPTEVIDFSNLSTLPPEYTVLTVDTSQCEATCVVSAVVQNLGGTQGAQAPSTIAFTMTDSAAGSVIGSCSVEVQPDVGFNATTTVSCIINGVSGQNFNAAIVTAAPTNPGRA